MKTEPRTEVKVERAAAKHALRFISQPFLLFQSSPAAAAKVKHTHISDPRTEAGFWHLLKTGGKYGDLPLNIHKIVNVFLPCVITACSVNDLYDTVELSHKTGIDEGWSARRV
jgi:hypothetical protein